MTYDDLGFVPGTNNTIHYNNTYPVSDFQMKLVYMSPILTSVLTLANGTQLVWRFSVNSTNITQIFTAHYKFDVYYNPYSTYSIYEGIFYMAYVSYDYTYDLTIVALNDTTLIP